MMPGKTLDIHPARGVGEDNLDEIGCYVPDSILARIDKAHQPAILAIVRCVKSASVLVKLGQGPSLGQGLIADFIHHLHSLPGYGMDVG